MQVPFRSSFVKSIGDGGDTSFWHEHWIGEDMLCNLFPRLYMLEIDKDTLIKERMKVEGGCTNFEWNWMRQPSGQTSSKFDQLLQLVSYHTHDNNSNDQWKWVLASNGQFTVKRLSSFIDEHLIGAFSLHNLLYAII
ncbi:uncharacterized protein [Rutidosis leptorrhynchoides]|uniref:uncharacterized protein n=1 Tax=Rutidosis leptorrhynchoides TaxID=125765 RepID=UPI003A996986